MQLIESRIYEAIKHALGVDVVALMEDDSVIEILRNANGSLCVERLGCEMEEIHNSLSDRNVESLIRLLASHAQESCGEKNPSLAIKLPYWHARFQALLPPVVDAPSFSIRKHAKLVFSLEHYLASESLSKTQYEVVLDAIAQRENIVISGGTGSGKTTIANAILAKMIASGDRIITVEDTPELRLPSNKSLQIFSKANIGYGSQQALKDILRLRPDRIVLGELRDGACLDLIKAWNTGHSGGLTTIDLRCPDVISMTCQTKEVYDNIRCDSYIISYAKQSCTFRNPYLPFTFSDHKETNLNIVGDIELFPSGTAVVKINKMSWLSLH